MENNSIKRILVVTESIDVEDSSGTKGRVALIKNLQKAGFELQVYHYTRKDIKLPGITCYSLKENRRGLLFFLSRLERYMRYWLKINPNKFIENQFGFSFTFFNDSNSIAAGLNKISDFDPDLVLTLSKGASFRPHHALLKIPKWHSRWMAYIHDPYPFACYPRPYDYVESGHQQKRDFFLKVARKAKYVAYPSKLLAEWMEGYYRPLKGKRIIIPHQIDEEYTSNASLPEFFRPEKFNILHAGTLLWGRDPMGLIKGFLQFLKETPGARENAKLLLIGNKNHYSKELEKISEQHPEIYVSEDYISFDSTQLLQKNTSVNVILEANGPISPFLPGKFPHCVQAKRPILLLGPYYSESKRILGENYKYWTEIDDIEGVARNLETLYNTWLDEPDKLYLKKPDLVDYLSLEHLKETVANL
ncbi:UDP-glycosyltransferase [Salegentibacter sp. JZCK2]|uniref:UDP-glycosyltransferase n=1 Tax=Salegentibacter tibetensis TaxID=2873600 RepID=UPI001CCFE25C|nr:UDP-glycosyltransferase [Salegentibacter tibetensis]MBZ9729751.1 UDP-glycosyltransferase [Salegentibacter tibetensis]